MTDHAARTGPSSDNASPEPSPVGPGSDSGTLTHFDEQGHARMVDVGDKDVTHRVAVATGEIRMAQGTMDLIRSGRASKGDVLGVARVAAIMGAKRTPDLVPMCHPLLLTRVMVDFQLHDADDDRPARVTISVRVETRGQTGVEMEALTAVSVAGLTVYDMVKAVDRGMEIGAIRVEEKHGGRSGDWHRPGPDTMHPVE